jgi:hypothetical protein
MERVRVPMQRVPLPRIALNDSGRAHSIEACNPAGSRVTVIPMLAVIAAGTNLSGSENLLYLVRAACREYDRRTRITV